MIDAGRHGAHAQRKPPGCSVRIGQNPEDDLCGRVELVLTVDDGSRGIT
jgi:hypothetical protein